MTSWYDSVTAVVTCYYQKHATTVKLHTPYKRRDKEGILQMQTFLRVIYQLSE